MSPPQQDSSIFRPNNETNTYIILLRYYSVHFDNTNPLPTRLINRQEKRQESSTKTTPKREYNARKRRWRRERAFQVRKAAKRRKRRASDYEEYRWTGFGKSEGLRLSAEGMCSVGRWTRRRRSMQEKRRRDGDGGAFCLPLIFTRSFLIFALSFYRSPLKTTLRHEPVGSSLRLPRATPQLLLSLDVWQELCSSNEQGGRVHPGEAGQRTDEEAGYGHIRIGLWPRDGRMRTDGAAAASWTDGAAAASVARRKEVAVLAARRTNGAMAARRTDGALQYRWRRASAVRILDEGSCGHEANAWAAAARQTVESVSREGKR